MRIFCGNYLYGGAAIIVVCRDLLMQFWLTRWYSDLHSLLFASGDEVVLLGCAATLAWMGDDILINYKLESLEIKDELVLAQGDQQFHPIAIYTGNKDHRVVGMVFEVSMDEILSADQYEVSNYKRVKTPLQSGKSAWIYVAPNDLSIRLLTTFLSANNGSKLIN